jgi:hypothetical protein
MEQTKEERDEMEKGLEDLVVFAERISDIFDPAWKSRIDVLKTVITVCSGAIVLTVGFSNSFRLLSVGPFWKQLVILSFVLLLLALLCAFVSLRFSATVYELAANFLNFKGVVLKAHRESEDFHEFLQTVARSYKEALDPVGRSDRWAIRFFKVSSACFFMAMLLLGIVGLRLLSL